MKRTGPSFTTNSMARRLSLVLLLAAEFGCARAASHEAPGSSVPATGSTPEPDPVSTPAPASEPDSETETELEASAPETTEASAPETGELTLHGTITKRFKKGVPLLSASADPRFTFGLHVTRVDPPSPHLPPGHYGLAVHSPSRTFRGDPPTPAKPVVLHVTMQPPPPDDPDGEPRFSLVTFER